MVDDTVASSVNVDVLRYADVAVSSLTKWFSGQGMSLQAPSSCDPTHRWRRISAGHCVPRR
ncbi:MAG: hypothetical protein R3F31_08705 [Verrucomicrobiales bacterium]